jgi:hypothetical protein
MQGCRGLEEAICILIIIVLLDLKLFRDQGVALFKLNFIYRNRDLSR